MWLYDLLGFGGTKKKKEQTHTNIILDAMLANKGIKTLWRVSDFQHGEYFVGYKASVAISKLRRKGLIENGPKDGRFQTYKLTDSALKV